MARPGSWIKVYDGGLYVSPADLWIDPSTAVPRAAITHGHADHARSGHGQVWATPETLAIMRCRYGEQAGGVGVPVGTVFSIGDVEVSFHPAGHVLGSAQIRLVYGSETVVVSGDFKRRADPTCAPFELLTCDIFITEATFALPVFRHPPAIGEVQKILVELAENPERCVLVGAYALGKAQRVIKLLRDLGHEAPIYIHGALQKLCELYQQLGVDLGDVRPAAGVDRATLQGKVIVAPPSALKDRWSRRLPDPITAFASGWMSVRQRARQSLVELPIILSDHADWDELTQTIQDIHPKEVWITHGREEALLHWCALHQIKARALALVGREDEDD